MGFPHGSIGTGRELGIVGDVPVEHALYPRLSPDGKRVALVIDGDLVGVRARWPSGAAAHQRPDLLRVAGVDARRPNARRRRPLLQAIAADGSVTTPKTLKRGHFHPHGWSPDGTQLLVASIVPRDPTADLGPAHAPVRNDR